MRRLLVTILAAGLSACATVSGDTSLHAPPDLTSFTLVRTDAGAHAPVAVSVGEAAKDLVRYDVIVIGEAHQHPANHLAEMELFRAIQELHPRMTLTMEQFERDVQPVLDDYLAGKIGESPFIDKSRAWGNYATSYRPLIEYAKDHKLPVIAANAPEKIVRCVGLEGLPFLGQISAEERLWAAAEFHTNDGPYKDKFMGFVGTDAGHGGDPNADKGAVKKAPSESALRSFAAQVTRDDTMAESIAHHLKANPDRKVIQINGSFHSENFLGTVERLKARMRDLKIAVINPVELEEDHPAMTADDAKSGTYVLLLRGEPDPYANEAEMKAAVARQVAARTKTTCDMVHAGVR